MTDFSLTATHFILAFMLLVSFILPENTRDIWFSDIFRRYKKQISDMKSVKLLSQLSLRLSHSSEHKFRHECSVSVDAISERVTSKSSFKNILSSIWQNLQKTPEINFFKKEKQNRVFCREIFKIFKNAFFKRTYPVVTASSTCSLTLCISVRVYSEAGLGLLKNPR